MQIFKEDSKKMKQKLCQNMQTTTTEKRLMPSFKDDTKKIETKSIQIAISGFEILIKVPKHVAAHATTKSW